MAKRRSVVALVVITGLGVLVAAFHAGALIEKRHAANRATLQAEIARSEALQAELEARRDRVKRDVAGRDEHREGSWLCERHRCNEGDKTPAWYRRRNLLPYSDEEWFGRALPPGLDLPRR